MERLNYTDIKSDLTQSTKEKNLGFFYSKTPEHDLDATFNFTAEYRQDVCWTEWYKTVLI